jgi:hypothetical protein
VNKPKHTYPAFEDLLRRVHDDRTNSWSEIAHAFLRIVEQFDREYGEGNRSTGWYQSKARYFNDLIVQLLSNQSSKEIAKRRKKDSKLFGRLDVDICYPGKGDPTIAGEVKALGTPPHPRNNHLARRGSADLHKRIREVAFTSLDIKVAYAPATPIKSFQAWIDTVPPGYFAFWAIRSSDATDFEKLRVMLSGLRRYCNGVGAIIYEPTSASTPFTYEDRTPQDLLIDHWLQEIAQRIA